MKAFTLVELLVVVAIIAMLAAMLLPSLRNARATAKKSTCASNLRQIGQAMNMYAEDFDGRTRFTIAADPWMMYAGGPFAGVWNWFPPGVEGPLALGMIYATGYAGSPHLFRCPGERRNPAAVWWAENSLGVITKWPDYRHWPTNSFCGNSYIARQESPGARSVDLALESNLGMVTDYNQRQNLAPAFPWSHLDGFNCLWADGHVRFVDNGKIAYFGFFTEFTGTARFEIWTEVLDGM